MEKTFGEVVLFARTGLNPRKNFTLGHGTNKYITIKNIHNNTLVIDANTDLVDDEAIAMIHRRSQIKAGDILFCSIGRIGDMYIIENEPVGWDVNESVFVFTLNTTIIRQKYFYYLFKHRDTIEYLIANSSGSTFKSIKMNQLQKMVFDLPSLDEQDKIVSLLDSLANIIDSRQQQLRTFDTLIKARFVEMFGDPITNTKKLDTKELKDALMLKAGDFTAASDISDEPTETNIYPCFGGNGIRGYVTEYNQEGEYSLIGRQGALSGNVQFASGKFKNTEHALLVTPLVEMNSIWLNQLLINLDLKRFQTGAAQPGLSVKNLQEIRILSVSIDEQNNFAEFVQQIDKSKVVIQKALDKAQLLFDSLMQKYFG